MSIEDELEQARSRPEDLLAAILEDHAEIHELLTAVTEAPEPEDRQRALELLGAKVRAHEHAEQEVVHPLLTDDRGEAVRSEHVEQEQATASMLRDLHAMEIGDEAFPEAFEQLRDALLEHAESEEDNELPLLEEALDADRLRTLAEDFRALTGAGD
jgi:hemerythrin superfamily protein